MDSINIGAKMIESSLMLIGIILVFAIVMYSIMSIMLSIYNRIKYGIIKTELGKWNEVNGKKKSENEKNRIVKISKGK